MSAKRKLERVSELQKIHNGGGLHKKWRQVVEGKLKGIPTPPRPTNSDG
jgi:hypothetical protein